VGVDEASGENVAAVATTNDFSDGHLLPELLEQIGEEIAQFLGDGTYDARGGYQAVDQHHAQPAIPPRHSARIWQHGNSNDPPLARDEKLGASGAWNASAENRRVIIAGAVWRRPRCFASRRS
jgi:DDE family transposase